MDATYSVLRASLVRRGSRTEQTAAATASPHCSQLWHPALGDPLTAESTGCNQDCRQSSALPPKRLCSLRPRCCRPNPRRAQGWEREAAEASGPDRKSRSGGSNPSTEHWEFPEMCSAPFPFELRAFPLQGIAVPGAAGLSELVLKMQ